jgi:hypothetical protein
VHEDATMKMSLIFALLIATTAGSADELRDIELRRLFDPTPAELRAEQAAGIYIYDGLRDTDIEHAMQEEFDRVESMMFIRVKRPIPQGKSNEKPDNDVVYVQDDDC